jgi:hypothetical protein
MTQLKSIEKLNLINRSFQSSLECGHQIQDAAV